MMERLEGEHTVECRLAHLGCQVIGAKQPRLRKLAPAFRQHSGAQVDPRHLPIRPSGQNRLQFQPGAAAQIQQIAGVFRDKIGKSAVGIPPGGHMRFVFAEAVFKKSRHAFQRLVFRVLEPLLQLGQIGGNIVPNGGGQCHGGFLLCVRLYDPAAKWTP